MTDTSDPLFGSGLRREPVLCLLCGTAWDERVVGDRSAPDDDVSLCPSCLLTTSHGEPFPEERPAPAAWSDAPEPA